LIPPQITKVTESAIKAVQKSGPDPVVFIFLGLVIYVISPVIEPKWLIVVMFFGLLATYCWRQSRAERHEIAMADKKLSLELVKIHAKKDAYKRGMAPTQPSLPLNSVSHSENKV